MGTRSFIAVKLPNEVRSIYCNWDGYPSHNGKILLNHYTDIDKINALISFGDLSSLGKFVFPIDPNTEHSFDSPQQDVCVFYGRDRKEKNTEYNVFNSTKKWMEMTSPDYSYLFDSTDSKWYYYKCGQVDKLVPLTKEICNKD